jgi:PhnB protein
MPERVSPIPDGFHTITPCLVVADPRAAIAFYERALGAVVLSRQGDGDEVRHAELLVGDSPIMLSPPYDYAGVRGRAPAADSSMQLYVYVEDADALHARAVGAGASEIMPVDLKPYGDRSGGVRDPFGHVWWIATRVARASAG